MVDAAFYQKDIGEAYFFSVDKYCRVKWEPYTSTEKRTWGPAPIKDHWKSLAQAGIDMVDAIIPVQGTADELYFLRGLEVVQIKFTPKGGGDVIVEGPVKTLQKWKSPAGTAVDRVGAGIVVPGVPGQAYLFSGKNYVNIDLVRDKVVYSPTEIAKEWPGVSKAGLDSVDAVLQVPEDKARYTGETYFFYKDRYARVQVVPSKPDVLPWGPARWENHWKSLDWIANRQQSSGSGSGSGSGRAGAGQPAQPQSLFSRLHYPSPVGRVGKNWYSAYRPAAVTGIEVWEGYWYATEYWGIRKVQLTWEDGYRETVGTDLGAQKYKAIWLNPRAGERFTTFYTQIGEIWDYLSIATNQNKTLVAGNSAGGHNKTQWCVGNGVLTGLIGYTWPPEIVQMGPVFGG
ncbi:Hemopexin-like domain-containing protein [Aspergillus karnatakaensis]|uniref:Hemopexin-like domain-containing protein n=1 Tax=Aspergillus karnatakaensis TaxID=1810916 RepID=UPI003CCCA8EA